MTTGLKEFSRRALRLLPTLVLAGCAAIHRPPTTVPDLLKDADVARASERTLRDTVVARLARRAIAKPDHSLDILLLSGGGQNGSYGIGFMRGWRERTENPMPQFDLITAISTGALQSPFVLLGTQASLDTLTDLYRNAADRIAPSLDWWFWLRKTGGLVNTRRLDDNIARVVDGPLRDSLGKAFAQDRQVIFGTTDMDLAIGRTWDLKAALDTGETGLLRARKLLRTAGAIPGIFPQVVVDGHVHSDGGVVSNILTLLTVDDYRAMAKRVRDAGVTAPIAVRLFVIVNGWTHATPVVIDPASRKQINARWSNIMFYLNQVQVLESLDNLAAAATGSIPGLTMQMKWTGVPAATALDPAANTLFNKQWMQKLEELGTTRARGTKPWDTIGSPYARPAP
jgi:hypothetical protein